MKGNKLHSILAEPYKYELEEFRYRVDADSSNSFIDMTLRKGDEIVVLRFWQPINLEIEKGFPQSTQGMVFYDVSASGLENIGVEVADFENCSGAITFSARKVERLN